MNVIDSSAWLEYFANSPVAVFFASAIEDLLQLIVPSITVYEVHKHILLRRGPEAAMTGVSEMTKGKLILLDLPISLEASRPSVAHKLPMADSIIYTTAMQFGATLWTTDKHFKGLPNVEYREKQS